MQKTRPNINVVFMHEYEVTMAMVDVLCPLLTSKMYLLTA